MEHKKNTNNKDLHILIVSQSFLLKSSLKETLSTTCDEYIVRTTDDILKVKDKHHEQEIGLILVVITDGTKWFENLKGLCLDAKLSGTKIVVCTKYTDEKTHKLLKSLRIDGTFSINATESEIIELFIDVNNNETRYLLPKDEFTGTIKPGKKGRTVMGGYIMKPDLIILVKLKRKGLTYKQIADANNFKVRTIPRWIKQYRKESKTTEPVSDYKYAIDNCLMEEGD